MIQLKNRIFVPLMTTLIVAIASCLAGCADRDDRPEPKDLDPSLQQAGEALNRAQAAMERAGVVIDFSDIGTLGNLTQILPDPLELAQPERQAAIQEAIGAMYDVLYRFLINTLLIIYSLAEATEVATTGKTH